MDRIVKGGILLCKSGFVWEPIVAFLSFLHFRLLDTGLRDVLSQVVEEGAHPMPKLLVSESKYSMIEEWPAITGVVLILNLLGCTFTPSLITLQFVWEI